jgi:hypothetical protein
MFSFIIGASRPKHGPAVLTAGAMMAFEKCDYSHIQIYFPQGWVTDDCGVYFEARNGQVNWCNENTFLETMEPVRGYLVRCSEAQIQDILDFCWSNCGKDYSHKELFGAMYCAIAERITGKENIKNPLGDGLQSEICSGIGARLLRIVDADVLKFGHDPQSLSPKDVVEICEQHGFERIL